MQPPSGVPSAPLMTENFHLCESVFHTVQVLQKAQSAFQSKDLVSLRKYVELGLQETTETLKNTEFSTDNPL
jgi:hypothetical protein